MIKILNITNSTFAIHKMKIAGIEGDFLSWDDILHDGPVPKQTSLTKLSKIRAKHISNLGLGSFAQIDKTFRERNKKLTNHSRYDKITLWLEHDLYDQLQLIQLLAWFHKNLASLTVLTSINTENYLGESSKEKILQLLSYDQVVSREHLILAEKAWLAFRQTKPLQWVELLKQPLHTLPFLEGAIIRLLEEYPNTQNGLSRTAYQALLIIENGISERVKIFTKNQEYETRKFMGDVLFWKILEDLEEHKLIVTTEKQHYIITPLGEEVLNNKKNFLQFKELDKWIGGVHLQIDNLWCWDIKKKTIAKYYYSRTLKSLLRIK